jgi:hypothetical protein
MSVNDVARDLLDALATLAPEDHAMRYTKVYEALVLSRRLAPNTEDTVEAAIYAAAFVATLRERAGTWSEDRPGALGPDELAIMGPKLVQARDAGLAAVEWHRRCAT